MAIGAGKYGFYQGLTPFPDRETITDVFHRQQLDLAQERNRAEAMALAKQKQIDAQKKANEIDPITIEEGFNEFPGKTAERAVQLNADSGDLLLKWHKAVEDGTMSKAEYALYATNLEKAVETWNKNGMLAMEGLEKLSKIDPTNYTPGSIDEARSQYWGYFQNSNNVRFNDKGNLEYYTIDEETGEEIPMDAGEFYQGVQPKDYIQERKNFMDLIREGADGSVLTMVNPTDGNVMLMPGVTKDGGFDLPKDSPEYKQFQKLLEVVKMHSYSSASPDQQRTNVDWLVGDTSIISPEEAAKLKPEEMKSLTQENWDKQVWQKYWVRAQELMDSNKVPTKEDGPDFTYVELTPKDVKRTDFKGVEGFAVYPAGKQGSATNPLESVNGVPVKMTAANKPEVIDGKFVLNDIPIVKNVGGKPVIEPVNEEQVQYGEVKTVFKNKEGEYFVEMNVPSEKDSRDLIAAQKSGDNKAIMDLFVSFKKKPVVLAISKNEFEKLSAQIVGLEYLNDSEEGILDNL